jgi:type IV pilus assembly protein PilM
MEFKLGLPKLGIKKVTIDWGSYALKIVGARQVKGAYTLDAVARVTIGNDLGAQLKKIWDEKGFSCANIALCVNGPDTLIRVVDFPKVDKKSMRESLGYELSHHTPFSQAEAYFDYAILDESKPDTTKLLVALAKKEFIDAKLELLSQAGLLPRQILLSSIALANAHSFFMAQADTPIAILDLGYSFSMITVVHKGLIVLSREMKRGAKEIFSRMQNVIGLQINSFKELEENHNKISQHTLDNVCTDLIEEVKMSLDFIESKENVIVGTVFVTEGLKACAGMKNIFSGSLGVPVESFDVVERFACAEDVKRELQAAQGDFAIATSSLLS